MANKTNEYFYLVALQYIRQGIATVDTCEAYTEEDDDSIILRSTTDPEKEVMKRDSYEKLSDEAKEVIDIVLNAPQEIAALFQTPKTRKVSARLLKNVLVRTWKSQFIVDSIFKELRKWTQSL